MFGIILQKSVIVQTAGRLWIGGTMMEQLKPFDKKCFVNFYCSYDCPNFQIDMANDRYGYGIADDMGLEKISCKQCRYHTGKCEDCLFVHSKDCPEYQGE